jgi:glycosyltransferase involved in cell wall biosynthesis
MQPGVQQTTERNSNERGSQSALVESNRDNSLNVPPPSQPTTVRLSAPEIDWSYAVIERMDPDTLKTTLIPFDLGKLVMDHDTSRNLALKHDGILAHLIRTGDYLKPYSIPKILEMTDSLALSYSRTNRVNLKSVMWSVGYKQDAQRLQQYEKSVIDDFDFVVLVSAVDRDFVASKAGSDKTLVCPAGVDVNVYPFDYSPDGSTIVFIGNNTAYHNIDAVLYFLEKVFPAVRSRHPRARFKVVGRIDKKLQTRLARHAGVVVTGQVDNIPNAVRGASVGVCPVRSGAGIQNKLLEYMALGVPAITSSIGLEGLRAMPGRDLLVAQTPGEWADHVCSMLEDPERGRGLAVAARSPVEQHYSWASMIAPLRAAICERLRSRRLPAPEGLPAIERGVPLDSVG